MGSVFPPHLPPQPPRGPPRAPEPHVPIPSEGMPDTPPFRIDRIEEMQVPNGLGEIVFMIDGRDAANLAVKLIVAVNPHSGQVKRAAAHLTPGAGYIATDPAMLPGNLVDVVGTIARETITPNTT